MSILVIAGARQCASLKAATLNVVTAASKIGGDVHVLVAGSNCGAVADAAAKIAGVNKVKMADNAAYQYQLAEGLGELVAELGKDYNPFWLPLPLLAKLPATRCSTVWMNMVSEIAGVVGLGVRPIYAGNAIATVKSADAIKVLTVRGTGFDAAAAQVALPLLKQ